MSKRASVGEPTETTLELVATAEKEDDEPASAAVVRALSTAAGVPFDDLPPLYEAVDPDALDALCASVEDSSTVSFSTGDLRVTITDGRTVEVRTQ